ncbi:probable fructose-2,6-bisphosphatase TIGAR A isoform X2 [Pangasianodon hypophthalmus]|uniref:probable fructose-2,6-bisphosphatase TIGAR A isoform X2 n=1 Tax=Pangasianodon hypophthalmus TaxID=310915 RepID=UPI0023074409|nr:probable fructose-2,6-bisphosphatase TIGAR A isoform X2 [Pangasianodon hypophthalmus]
MLSFGLTIIRHGETQYNKDGLLQGQGIDSPLSETGVQQAEAAGQYLQDVHFTNVFASDMKRAKQSFGIAEGGQVEEMKNMAKAAGQPIPEYTPPEGETMDQVKIRISTFLKSLFQQMADEHQDKICQGDEFQPDGPLAGRPDDGVQNVSAHALVVSHGAYMRVAMRYFIEDLACAVPPGANMAEIFSACPNTGMCRFIVTLKSCDANVQLSGMKCVFVNRRDHFRAGNN